MSNMVEIDIDFDCFGEVEMVLAHDECGEHDDVEFYRNDLLAAENAKLRELVRDMWHELDAATQYDAGGVRGIVSEFADSMRDLGIEVEQ